MALLVLDTNSLLRSISKKSPYHDLWVSFFDGRNRLCVTNEILEEYEELIHTKSSSLLASLVIKAIINSPYTIFVTPYYSFNLISSDPDDNKFVDCAITANAKFIISDDRHFKVLENIDFPKVDLISLEEIIKRI